MNDAHLTHREHSETMLYLPRRVWEMDEGHRLFLVFRDIKKRLNTVEIEVGGATLPKLALSWGRHDLKQIVRILRQTGREVYAHDFRIRWQEHGMIQVLRRNPF